MAMKINITLEEALKILKQHLEDKTSNILVFSDDGKCVSHIEGYPDVVIDGFEFEVKE